jgi:adenosylmethionine-8-amino-7-oxononanoate aminotransferase
LKKTYLIKPILDQDYPVISHGQGVYLYDINGKRYLDGSSGAVTATIGHNVKEIVEVMTEQAKKISFVYRSQFTNEPAEQLAEKLCLMSPGDLEWTFFVNSGSEATETAMKIAIQHWQEKKMKGKNKILSRWMSYHGITLGALSMSGHTTRRARFVPLLHDYPNVSPPYCYRCPFHLSYPSCALMCAHELEKVIHRIGAEHIAAFIAEPVVGAALGAIVPPDGYYQTIKEICHKNDILFIADEVMTGMGRTGKMFAIEHWNVKPDIAVLGKGLGAGYTPIAAALASNKVMEPILNGSKLVMSGHTYSANPQSAAVALAVINFIEKNKLVESAQIKGQDLLTKLKQLQQKYPIIGDVRGKGLLVGIEFVSNVKSKLPFKKELNVTQYVVQTAQNNGLIVYPAAAGNEREGDAILIAPPLPIQTDEMDELINLLEKTVSEVQGDLLRKGIISGF